ncbi:hypothetical protein ABB37_07461 [Leptomonas pyrrhocoris]|uniref:Uncharacterized protein n=1 Tax=Leptomonas pyrrhocoris TaxID=157538 RepID=A0A0N0DSU6_LEPPY|nr:hypothetical protein ABB37_07461 [Leptomonas pyrrhocoris]KPA76592.1 hypothetical protein ABB37_07461 [Leptomonas pyrrhocoris]|eukprot:XP_015655031.1 hypothetical protein ABB37_07461 [Leptomonas pyrrhocoris]
MQRSRDAIGWWCVFFLLGAPVFPARRTVATFLCSVIVSCTWPLPLLAWCAHLSAALQRERFLEPELASAVDLFTVTPQDVNDEGKQQKAAEPSTKRRSSAARASSITVDAAVDFHDDAHAVKGAELRTNSSEVSRCFVLAAVLLCGSLFGQLDWQLPCQVWPYPSLTAYVVARALYGLMDLKAKLYSPD